MFIELWLVVLKKFREVSLALFSQYKYCVKRNELYETSTNKASGGDGIVVELFKIL